MRNKPLSNDELTHLIAGLHRLAHNLWWTWDQGAQEIFQELSPRGWQNLYHNAVAILHEVSDYELRVRLQDPDFAATVRQVLAAFEAYMGNRQTWAAAHAPSLVANPVAYFSAEFGFHETLPIAAGAWASSRATTPNPPVTWASALRESRFSTAKGIFNRQSTAITGRPSTTRSLTPAICPWNRFWAKTAHRWFATSRLA